MTAHRTQDLFDLVFKTWQRPVKEVDGYKVIETENGKTIVFNALGINKDDVSVETVGKELVVKGETSVDEISFTNKISYRIYLGDKSLDKITYALKDGLLYITIWEKKEKTKVKILYQE